MDPIEGRLASGIFEATGTRIEGLSVGPSARKATGRAPTRSTRTACRPGRTDRVRGLTGEIREGRGIAVLRTACGTDAIMRSAAGPIDGTDWTILEPSPHGPPSQTARSRSGT